MTAPTAESTTPQRVTGSGVGVAVLGGDGLDVWVAVGGRSVGEEVSVGLGSVGDAGLSDGIDGRVGDGAAGGATCDGYTE